MESFQRIAIDILDMPESSDGNKHIMVVQDYFSKWIEAKAIKASTSAIIASWLNEDVFCRFGIPMEIMSDRGPQFESVEFRNFCANLGIRQLFSTPYHHQANGMVERLNRSILNILRMYIKDDQLDWDTHLPATLFAYRTSVHSVTGKSPFEFIQVRRPRMPGDAMFPTASNGSPEGKSIVERMTFIRNSVREKLRKNEKSMKANYHKKKKVKESKIQVGMRVYWRKPSPKVGRSPKLSPQWVGPFEVLQKVSNVNFEIVGGNSNSTTVHGNYLKECLDKNIPLANINRRGRPRKVASSSCGTQSCDGGVVMSSSPAVSNLAPPVELSATSKKAQIRCSLNQPARARLESASEQDNQENRIVQPQVAFSSLFKRRGWKRPSVLF